MVVSAAVGFTYMIASLTQLDLAARSCTPETAATVFAILMSLCNLSLSLSTYVGSSWYESLGQTQQAFDFLVIVGALSTALCWPLTWVLRGTFRALLSETETPRAA